LSQRFEVQALEAPPGECYYNTLLCCSAIYGSVSYTANVIFFIIECGIARFLCAMCVFDVRASSSSPRLLLCQISFLWRPPLLS